MTRMRRRLLRLQVVPSLTGTLLSGSVILQERLVAVSDNAIMTVMIENTTLAGGRQIVFLAVQPKHK